jgi:hypothetical protein
VQAGNFEGGTAYAAFDRHTFGDHAPYVFRTTDYGKTWTPLLTGQDVKGVRGYAHVIKEDLLKPNLLFLGTEFGSLFPSMAVRPGLSSKVVVSPQSLYAI